MDLVLDRANPRFEGLVPFRLCSGGGGGGGAGAAGGAAEGGPFGAVPRSAALTVRVLQGSQGGARQRVLCVEVTSDADPFFYHGTCASPGAAPRRTAPLRAAPLRVRRAPKGTPPPRRPVPSRASAPPLPRPRAAPRRYSPFRADTAG